MNVEPKPKYLQIILKGSLAVSVAEMSTKVIGLFLLPVFTIYLSPSDYGIISLTLLIVTCLNLIYNPGMLSATTRLYHATTDHKERQLIIGSASRFFLIVPFLVLVLGLFFGEYITNLFFEDFNFYPFGVFALFLAFCTQIKRLWSNLMTLQYKIELTAFYSVIAAVIGVLLSVLLVVVLNLEAFGRILALIPSAIFLAVVSVYYINKFTNKLWSLREIKRLLKFGAPLIFAIWSYEILNVADRFIIEKMLGVAALGIYSFSYAIGESQKFLLIGIKKLWTPIFYENMNESNYTTIKRLMSIFIAIVTIINALIILFCKEFVLCAVNERYYESISLIGIIVCGLYFNSLLIIFSSSLSYKNKFSSISKIALFSSMLNIVLNICLIPYLGLFGCAVATLISYLIYFIIGFYLERKTIILFTNFKILSYSILFVLLSFFLTLFVSSEKLSIIEITSKVALLIVYLYTLHSLQLYTISQLKDICIKTLKKLKKN